MQNMNIERYLKDVISNNKNGSDSLSEGNDNNPIIEADLHEEDEEEKILQYHKPNKKLSNESASKSFINYSYYWFHCNF